MAKLSDNLVLQHWLDIYDSIYDDYLRDIASTGVRLSASHANRTETKALLARLREKGATLRNAGASVSTGMLSTACIACTGSLGSETFHYSLECQRHCYFCFNPNQGCYGNNNGLRDWRAELKRKKSSDVDMTHIALTGGEPLIHPEEALAFFRCAHTEWPDAHLRLYTTGDQLSEELLDELVDAGLSEIRFSIKLEDDATEKDAVLERIALAASRDLDVMVEMPVIPGTFDEMRELILVLDGLGIFGINLLEFCYPFSNWPEFEKRGFEVKNPPFPVLYDYEYAGGLPIDGSEIEALKLVEFALDSGIRMGVHYCSLENKHRDQILTQNRSTRFSNPTYMLDEGDYFWKTCKVFGVDVPLAKLRLKALTSEESAWTSEAEPAPWRFDADDDCLQFHPRLKLYMTELPITIATSYNVLERRQNGTVVRELALKVD